MEPLFVINEVGPYLYHYREQIYNLNDDNTSENFFLENNYDTELKTSINRDKADMVSYIIPKAKECARNLPPHDMTEYKNYIIGLLDDYIDYLATRIR